MPVWETVTLAVAPILGAVVGAAIALFGTWLTNRTAQQLHEAETATRTRQRGAEALAPVGALLADIDPDELAFNVRPASADAIRKHQEQWKELRERTLVVGTSEPIPHLAEATQRLVTAVGNAINSAAWLVNNRLKHEGDLRFDRELARCDHSRALDILDVTLSAVRGESIRTALISG